MQAKTMRSLAAVGPAAAPAWAWAIISWAYQAGRPAAIMPPIMRVRKPRRERLPWFMRGSWRVTEWVEGSARRSGEQWRCYSRAELKGFRKDGETASVHRPGRSMVRCDVRLKRT